VPRYGTPADLARFGLTADVLADIELGDQEAALDAASDLADTYLRAHQTLPLVRPYPLSLVRNVCIIAGYDLLSIRGYSVQGNTDTWKDRYDAAIRWFEALSKGTVNFDIAVDQTPLTDDGGPQVSSDPPRGWRPRTRGGRSRV
jgi:phage gp36-like protein